MIGFAESLLAWLGLTLLPAFTGLLIVTWTSRRVPVRYVVAFAFGILFWFFVDTISGSAALDVNSGFGGGLAQVGVVVLFLVGAIFFFWVDRNRGLLSPQAAVGKYGLTIPVLVAIALGIHGLGEGAAYGATAYSTSSISLLNAFGGLYAGIAYVLHKGLEPMMVGACYSFYNKSGGTVGNWLRNVFSLSVVFVRHRCGNLRGLQACRPVVCSQRNRVTWRAYESRYLLDSRNHGTLRFSPISLLNTTL